MRFTAFSSPQTCKGVPTEARHVNILPLAIASWFVAAARKLNTIPAVNNRAVQKCSASSFHLPIRLIRDVFRFCAAGKGRPYPFLMMDGRAPPTAPRNLWRKTRFAYLPFAHIAGVNYGLWISHHSPSQNDCLQGADRLDWCSIDSMRLG
jgi:hypothetical protein